MSMRSSRVIPVLSAIGVAAVATAAPPVFTGPLPYQSITDSPYFADGQTCYALETFPEGMQSVSEYQFNSQTGAAIVPGVGVPPGGHVLQANPLGVIQLSFDPPVNEAGFVWTGGDPIGSTITMTVISGTEAISQQYADLSPNAPDNPDDNRFFGVAWDVGIQQLRITFLPFSPSISNQIDDIQFNLSPQVVTIDPMSAAFEAAGGTGSFSVTMNGPACGWSASTGDPWITLTTASGTGDGSVQFTVAENLGADIRTGTIAVGSFSFTVNQSSASCEVTGISPTETTVAAAGASDSFDVAVTAPDCAWSATASDGWITLTTASGTGNGPVPFSVAENTSAEPRSGTIAVGGFTFAVNQEPAACAVTGISATEAVFESLGGSGFIIVSVNGATCPWEASSDVEWLVLTTDAGTGSGPIEFEVMENSSDLSRLGSIFVGDFVFTVSQFGINCGKPLVAPILVSPVDEVANSSPTFIWDSDPCATWYQLWVNDSTGTRINTWYTAEQVGASSGQCSITPGTSLAIGTVTWWVRSWNEQFETGPWSAGSSFTVDAFGPPTLIAPSGSTSTNFPLFTWQPVTSATWYQLWVNDASGTPIRTWYTAEQVGAASGTCRIAPGVELASGSCSWWVRSWNAIDGTSAWSPAKTFQAGVWGAPTVVEPSESSVPMPTYTWQPVSGATWYQLWVNDSAGTAINQWFTAAQVNAASGQCSVMPSVELAAGNATWWVRAWNSTLGNGPWSPGRAFIVAP